MIIILLDFSVHFNLIRGPAVLLKRITLTAAWAIANCVSVVMSKSSNAEKDLGLNGLSALTSAHANII